LEGGQEVWGEVFGEDDDGFGHGGLRRVIG
jgi:hypothetical protein